jgi:hypothetical protein
MMNTLSLKKNTIITSLFLIWACVYVVTSIFDMSIFVRNSGISDYTYFIKHLSFIPFIFLVFLYKKQSEIWVYMLLFLLYFIFSVYFIEFDYENLYGRLMYPFFLFFGFLYTKVDNKELILKVIFIIAIVTIYSLILVHIVGGENMTFYTNRDRVSLGFGLAHFPILVAILVIMTDYIKLPTNIKILFNLPALLFIVLSFSRTALLIIIAHFFMKLNRKYFKFIYFILFTFVVSTIYFLEISFENIDKFSTGRLSLWMNILNNNFSTQILFIGLGENVLHMWEHHNRANIHMVHFDNSYLEIFLKMGILGVLAIIGVFFIWQQMVKKKNGNYRYGNSIIIALLIAMFNTILFSTGNIVFVILVLLALSPVVTIDKRFKCL